jgi:hypothetical protein
MSRRLVKPGHIEVKKCLKIKYRKEFHINENLNFLNGILDNEKIGAGAYLLICQKTGTSRRASKISTCCY